MKTTEIKKSLKGQKIAELTKSLEIENDKLMRLKMELAAKKLKDYSKISKARKQIARIYTIINQKLEEEHDTK